jgi:ATP-dependent RNA helicase DeaD
MENFAGLNLPAALAASLTRMKYDTPTPIQAKAIPLAMQGRDILGSAQTGTGKTAAFAIPILARLMTSPRGGALILSPTRELATQIMSIMTQLLAGQSAVKAALLIGGESMSPQLRALSQRPRLIVGTPGRIIDHLERGSLMLHDTGFLVLDETDRMLDMGFGIQIEKIIPYLQKQRQTLLFSATLPPAIVKLSSKYLINPERVSAGEQSKPAENLLMEKVEIEQADKYDRLVSEIEKREGSIIVFVKTKRSADKLAAKLAKQKLPVDAIHGDLRQNQRDRAIANFRNGKTRIMIATDIAARGLDIPHIRHVINFDLPQVAEDYIHRIGRTARAGAEGSSMCFITREDGEKWRAIQRLLDPNAPVEKRESAPRGESRGSRRGGNQRRRGNGASGSHNGGHATGRSNGHQGGGQKTASSGASSKPAAQQSTATSAPKTLSFGEVRVGR